jgi:hypothetical protein
MMMAALALQVPSQRIGVAFRCDKSLKRADTQWRPAVSYTRVDVEAAPYEEERRFLFLPALGFAARVSIWGIANAVLVFVEHLSELIAPLLLIAGFVWYAVPRVLAAITLDGQANDLLQIVRGHVPHDIYIEGTYYSAGTLIWDGIYLIALVAICRTLSTAITSLLLDRA